jgi:hypothetical protein
VLGFPSFLSPVKNQANRFPLFFYLLFVVSTLFSSFFFLFPFFPYFERSFFPENFFFKKTTNSSIFLL